MQKNVEAFLRVLDPNDNSTGGGTASAVAGAMAAALVAMVARLSVGRKGMEPESYYLPIVEEGEVLSKELFGRGREDSEAFDLVMAAVRMAKTTDDEKAERARAMEAATIHATEVPLANAEGCRRVIELCEKLRGRSNPNAGSDLESAGYLARAGLSGCLANVAINLPGIKDRAKHDELKKRADRLSVPVRTE